MNEFLTCVEIARKYNLTRATVHRWIREKKLRAMRAGRTYLIKSTDLIEFEKQRMTM
ncbi:hypothetical protein CE91St36_03010 [Christensenellaceae bacterium]|nr:hypothetical protein CE91St36_03010 [Christensenellaceae bacterium]BDF60152.1 hypothetical protein CE91St37_03020 [Christensenellaceae bacterium]